MNIKETFDNISVRDAMHQLLNGIGLQTRQSMSSQVLTAAGFLGIGLIVGGALGLLFAPSSGRHLRSQIKEKMGAVADRAMEAAQSMNSNAHDRPISNSSV